MPRPTASNGPSEPSARRRGRLSPMSDAPPPSGPRSMARTVALGSGRVLRDADPPVRVLEPRQPVGGRSRRHAPGDRHGSGAERLGPGARDLDARHPLHPRRATRSSSVPATSPTASSIRARRRRSSSTRSRGPSSPPATTPTRMAAPPTSATATRRPGAATSTGRGLRAGNHDWETDGPRGLPRLFRRRGPPRTARVGTRTTSGRGT